MSFSGAEVGRQHAVAKGAMLVSLPVASECWDLEEEWQEEEPAPRTAFFCAVCRTGDEDWENEAFPGVCRHCYPFVIKQWRAAVRRGKKIEIEPYIDGIVMRGRQQLWEASWSLRANIPKEEFVRECFELVTG